MFAMSMPTKGKHHLPHHHQQLHHQQQQQVHHNAQQHQLIVNVNQTGVPHSQAYNTVNQPRFLPNTGSDFHVPGQSYGTQPGGQVGGGGGSVGVPGGRGPPPLGGIQSIGQSASGIPPGGPTGGQQAPPQASAPGIQTQQPQGPAPTTTPPVHTPSPQEMGKHLQTQPPPLQQVYVSSQTRPASQGYYPAGPRPQQPRGLNHRGSQGGSGAQVVGMAGVGGGGGQPTAIYPHAPGLTVQPTMYVQSQVPGIHAGAHQQSVYPMNNQMPMQFSGPQRHQTHQNQSFYQPFQPHALITTQNLYAYTHGPAPQHGFYYPSSTVNISRASASAVSGGAQHVGGPLTGAQGAAVVPQGTLQQPTQPQPMPPMAMPLPQTDVYPGHNGGATNNTTRSRNRVRQHRINDIVDPTTGENISSKIYTDEGTAQSSNSNSREVQPPQNNNATMVAAEFAASVMKVLTESSDSGSPVSASTAETPASQNASQTLANSQTTNSNNDTNSQCNVGSHASTQSISNTSLLSSNQTLSTSPSSSATQIDSCAVKTESKPAKEFHPRTETKTVVVDEQVPQAPVTIVNKDNIPVQPAILASTPVTELEVKATNVSPNVSPSLSSPSSASPSSMSTTTTTSTVSSTSSSAPFTTMPSANVPEAPKPSVTALNANPVPAREPFPNLSNKTSSCSPPRRKSQTHSHAQLAAATEQPPTAAKEPKEKKVREKSAGSRGTTPIPVHSQPEQPQHQKANGDANADKSDSDVLPRNEVQQKSSDGKAMQKQKNKNKFKSRELNRRGAEKEGTDMDAFVNTVPTTKAEVKQQDNKELSSQKDSNKEIIKEITKDIKEKDNYESKKEKESTATKPEKHVAVDSAKESTPISTPLIEKVPSNKEASKGSSPKIEEQSKPQNVCNAQVKSVPNDVVDHAKIKEDDLTVDALVAQKNEENSKVSALRSASEDKPQAPQTIEESSEKEPAAPVEVASKIQPTLKYTYKDDQWSPLNKSGKKVYDREFLMKLQDDPNSKIKPPNLPDLDVVLKDITKPRATVDLRPFKDTNLSRHDALFPGFIKPALSARALPPNKKSHPGKPKATKPNVIHVSLSLREDVKLRETENAWKPTRMKPTTTSQEDVETEALYKKVRSVLNKLTPQKFTTLVEQVRALTINTQERLQGVINLVFEKAVDEPNFSVAYALMCKELSKIKVTAPEKGSENQDTSVNFRTLILNRCQKEFEKNPFDESARAARIKEIEECTDPEKKKDLQLSLEEEERRIRIKSVGNIRFIGELFKQEMLTTKIMHRCIKHLLEQNDEDSLECLCKLLTTIGKDLEAKSAEDMQSYFNRMQEIVAYKGPRKISSRIRFMLQDVLDLRAKKWVPRRDDSNPKTIDQIQKEAESERMDTQLNNTPLNTPRKDDRNSDRKRNRVGMTDDGWSQPVSRTRQTYSVETSKLKNKPPAMDDLTLGSRNMFMWKNMSVGNSKAAVTPSVNKFAALENIPSEQDKRMPLQLAGSRSTGPREYGRSDYKSSYDGRGSRNGSHQLSSSRESPRLETSRSQSVSMPPSSVKSVSQPTSVTRKPPMSDEEFTKALNTITRKYLKEVDIDTAISEVKDTFDNTTFAKFVSESVNNVLEKSSIDRERISRLMSRLVSQNILPLQSFIAGFNEVLEIVDDLIIDIPKIWMYLAEILSRLIEDETLPLAEVKNILSSLKSPEHVARLMGTLLAREAQEKGPGWVTEKWDQSGLQWSNIFDPKLEISEKIIKENNLGFLTGDTSAKSSGHQLSLQQIHEQLKRLMKEKAGFDNICSWIMANVGDRTKEPKFIRILMTAILETSIELENEVWKLNAVTLKNLLLLIQRFADTNEDLELECLYAVQLHLHKLQYPSGILKDIMNMLYDTNTIANETFLAWHDTDNPAEHDGYSVAQVALTSFFVHLQEPDDSSSVEEGPTGVNQDAC